MYKTVVLFACLAAIQSDVVGGTEPALDPTAYKLNPPEDVGYSFYPVRIMDRSTHEIYEFDPRAGETANVSYSVSKDSWIRLRLVQRGNKEVIVATLQPWEERSFGQDYVVEWDGRDASGNIVENKKMFVLFESKDRARNGVHQEHDVGFCRDFGLVLESPRASHVSGTVEISAARHGPAVQELQEYEGRVYVDYALVATKSFRTGDKPGISLDTTTLANGPHMITVNLDDLSDHIGTASVRVNVRN